MKNTDVIFKIISVEELGKVIAHASDEEQAGLLNSFARELIIACRDTELSGMQPCYISSKLDINGKKLVASLNEFVTLGDKTKPEVS